MTIIQSPIQRIDYSCNFYKQYHIPKLEILVRTEAQDIFLQLYDPGMMTGRNLRMLGTGKYTEKETMEDFKYLEGKILKDIGLLGTLDGDVMCIFTVSDDILDIKPQLVDFGRILPGISDKIEVVVKNNPKRVCRRAL